MLNATTNVSHPPATFVDRMVREGKWQPEVVPANVVGLTRDVTVYRTERKTNLITHDQHGDDETHCPSRWSDLRIGSGACGLGCRACFLMLTHRGLRDPLRPLIYSNVEDFWRATEDWLKDPQRCSDESLGLGLDCCDSLLYEGITSHARHLIPVFADPAKNPKRNLLVLLTKSRNVFYLEGLPRDNTVITFSLNPETIAGLWEGVWPRSMERITPLIENRLWASRLAQRMGFQTRWRIDPILTPPGWQAMYKEFFAGAAGMGLQPARITLGTYREKTPQLDTWRRKWGLPPMEWEPTDMVKHGTHYRLESDKRIPIYRTVIGLCEKYFPDTSVDLCKETHDLRAELGLSGSCCNCLKGSTR